MAIAEDIDVKGLQKIDAGEENEVTSKTETHSISKARTSPAL